MAEQQFLLATGDAVIGRQQRASRLPGKAASYQEVTVAVDKIDPGAAVAEFAQTGNHGTSQGAGVIVADPGLEKVAEDIQLIGVNGFLFHKAKKRPGDSRAFLCKV